MLLETGLPVLNIALSSILAQVKSLVHAILSYASQPMIIVIVFCTLVTYSYITKSIRNGRTEFPRKVNTVGGDTIPGSDINLDECNKSRNEISHTYLLVFMHNIKKT